MAKTTIAEKRAKAVIELANRTTGNIENAKKAMNAYYRLCIVAQLSRQKSKIFIMN